MSDMKCPFCGRELSEYDHFDRLLVCFNPQCEAVFTKKDFLGNKNLWQELIRTKKQLEIAVDALKRVAANYPRMTDLYRMKIANEATEQITALEQKDK
jgi:hypothetical protein